MELITLIIIIIIFLSVFYILILKLDRKTELRFMKCLLENCDSVNEFRKECRQNGISERRINLFLKDNVIY